MVANHLPSVCAEKQLTIVTVYCISPIHTGQVAHGGHNSIVNPKWMIPQFTEEGEWSCLTENEAMQSPNKAPGNRG